MLSGVVGPNFQFSRFEMSNIADLYTSKFEFIFINMDCGIFFLKNDTKIYGWMLLKITSTGAKILFRGRDLEFTKQLPKGCHLDIIESNPFDSD